MSNSIRCGFPQKFCDAFVGSNRDDWGNRQTVSVSQEYLDCLEEVKARRDASKHAKYNRAVRNSQISKNCAKKGDSRAIILKKAKLVKKAG